jgi:hypothetical protein
MTQRASVECRPMNRKPGPRQTLGDLHRATPWLWLHCEKCQHKAPIACAVPVIRWGAERRPTCCGSAPVALPAGHRGATLQHPGWGGADIGFLPESRRRSSATRYWRCDTGEETARESGVSWHAAIERRTFLRGGRTPLFSNRDIAGPGDTIMRFHIEVVRDTGANIEIVYRATVDEMSPHRAQIKAGALLNLYAGRGANGVRVLDDKNKEIYKS